MNKEVTAVDILTAVTRLETKMDIYAGETKSNTERLDKVEKRQTYAMGAAGATGFLLSLALAIAGLFPK